MENISVNALVDSYQIHLPREVCLNVAKNILLEFSDKENILRSMAKIRHPLYLECSNICIKEKDNPDLVVEQILKNLNIMNDGNS